MAPKIYKLRGGVDFLVHECLVNEVEFIINVGYEAALGCVHEGIYIMRREGKHCTWDVCIYICLLIVYTSNLFCWVISMLGLLHLHK